MYSPKFSIDRIFVMGIFNRNNNENDPALYNKITPVFQGTA